MHFSRGAQPPCWEEAQTTPRKDHRRGVLATAQLKSASTNQKM